MKPLVLDNDKEIPVTEVKGSKVYSINKDVDSENWGDAFMAIVHKSQAKSRPVVSTRQTKLDPIVNNSMAERLVDFGIEEER